MSTERLNLATPIWRNGFRAPNRPRTSSLAAQAKDEFLKVLEQDPKNDEALAYLGSLAFNQANLFP